MLSVVRVSVGLAAPSFVFGCCWAIALFGNKFLLIQKEKKKKKKKSHFFKLTNPVVEFDPDPVVGVGNGSGRCKASGSVIARMDGAGIVLSRRLGGVPIHFPVIYPFGIVLVIVLPPRSSILVLVIVIRSESSSARWVGGILLCLDLYCYVVPDVLCQWKGSGHAGLEVSL